VVHLLLLLPLLLLFLLLSFCFMPGLARLLGAFGGACSTLGREPEIGEVCYFFILGWLLHAAICIHGLVGVVLP